MTTSYLTADALVTVQGDRVAILCSSARVDITLDAPPMPSTSTRPAVDIVSLARELGITEVGAFEAALFRGGLLRTQPDSDLDLTSLAVETTTVLSLAELLTRAKAGAPTTEVLALTAEEALWTGMDPETAAIALNLFVARLPDWARRVAYGATLSGSVSMISADLPGSVDVRWALDMVGNQTHPAALDLSTRTLTGSLETADAALKPDGGRLAVAGQMTSETLGTRTAGIFHVSAVAADPHSLADPFNAPHAPTRTSGGAADLPLAELKCFSEAAEFLISNTGIPSEARYCCAADLVEFWLSPADLISYHEQHRARLGVSEFDIDEPQWWVPGLRDAQRIWLPAVLVTSLIPEWPRWFHPSATSSSGVAAHPVLKAAIRSAWLEAVERDAFQRCRILAGAAPPARVEPKSLPTAERSTVELLAEVAEVSILKLESPTAVPVIMVRTDTQARVGFGCAAAHDPLEALRRALIEAVGQVSGALTPVMAPEQVRTPLDHASLYSGSDWRGRLDWMWDGDLIPWTQVRSAADHGLPGTAAVHTFAKPFPLPVQVVRVLDPTLIPITFGYDTDPDGRPDFMNLWRGSSRPLDRPLEPHPLA